MTARLVIGADMSPFGAASEAFAAQRPEEIFEGWASVFREADLAVVNLECPLTDCPRPPFKSGPVIKGVPGCARALAEAGIGVCGLANNHIMDYGARGLRDTLRTCGDQGIRCVGAGENEVEAGRPLKMAVQGLRVALLAVAEQEWSMAGPDRPGANPLDVPVLMEQVQALRAESDFIAVLLHGGKEHYPLPYPRLQQWCRHVIRAGAQAVICQHTHCMGACEDHAGGFISYGQGNLIFPSARHWRPGWDEGYALRFVLHGGGRFEVERLYYRMAAGGIRARRLTGAEETAARTQVEAFSTQVLDEALVRESWRRICLAQRDEYYAMWGGLGRWLRALNRRLPFMRSWYTPKRAANLLNCMRCETHRETGLEILEAGHEALSSNRPTDSESNRQDAAREK